MRFQSCVIEYDIQQLKQTEYAGPHEQANRPTDITWKYAQYHHPIKHVDLYLFLKLQ